MSAGTVPNVSSDMQGEFLLEIFLDPASYFLRTTESHLTWRLQRTRLVLAGMIIPVFIEVAVNLEHWALRRKGRRLKMENAVLPRCFFWEENITVTSSLFIVPCC